MGKEIEHKYLVDTEKFSGVKMMKSKRISQGYILNDPSKTIRVRISDSEAFITIKGPTKNATRSEYEYSIPLSDAEELLQEFCEAKIEKIRHIVQSHEKTWEVDEFLGLNKGLWIAEIELSSENEEYMKPEWITTNVTSNHAYANANLVRNPFSTWRK